MAGEWLKFEKATPEKQEVFSIAAHLDINPDEAVGKLIRVWSWFDTHTTDGHAASVTPALLDRVAGVTGFVRAMERVGWINVTPEGVSLPNFERHTGETAKGRALSAQRSSNHRAKRHATTVTDAVTNSSPREEKRREENKDNSAPSGAYKFFPGIDRKLVADFAAVRKAKRAAITQTAIDGIQREANKANLTMTQVLTLCCERGWSGFKASWLDDDKSGKPLTDHDSLMARAI